MVVKPRTARITRPPPPKIAPVLQRATRVLVASHGHPAITRGGAEIAAYSLFKALRQRQGFEAWFLGCRPDTGEGRLGTVITQPFGASEFIYRPGSFDWFKFANRDAQFPDEFRRLLLELRPDVIHFHHFAIFGLEAFALAKSTLPNARVILTFHEYLLICNAFGQMVTSQDQHLCYQASFDACKKCFPERSTADFFLRRHYAELFLRHVDTIIAPSLFLKQRLLDWGLQSRSIEVIENLVEGRTTQDEGCTDRPRVRGPLRVGFFGQISRLKGISVLFQAARFLEIKGQGDIEISIYGEYRGQPPEFQTEFLEQLEQSGSNICYHGPYRSEQVDGLMQRIDIVVVPSIWWENSPVVIQEAIRNNRSIICSNIGGMAEKIRDGIDGWHIQVGSPGNLAALLEQLAADFRQIDEMRASMRIAVHPDKILEEHSRIYRQDQKDSIQ